MKALLFIMKLLLRLSCIVLLFICAITFWKRLSLPYNTEGNYFDEANSIVYHQQAVGVFGFLSLLFLVILVVSFVRKKK
ncbi:MAG: hypothetical protein DI598_00495 [Pseudopedobacter saltans]|uniref:Uncharacterized protein n=1 Tax=Pseudopedobacter saltans TaxID=151895 RepID=A0A2W5FB01_9SPHI|nr:MAG: hypothetical protein DI598_00495 [Pseudopedobacter saltans]